METGFLTLETMTPEGYGRPFFLLVFRFLDFCLLGHLAAPPRARKVAQEHGFQPPTTTVLTPLDRRKFGLALRDLNPVTKKKHPGSLRNLSRVTGIVGSSNRAPKPGKDAQQHGF